MNVKESEWVRKEDYRGEVTLTKQWTMGDETLVKFYIEETQGFIFIWIDQENKEPPIKMEQLVSDNDMKELHIFPTLVMSFDLSGKYDKDLLVADYVHQEHGLIESENNDSGSSYGYAVRYLDNNPNFHDLKNTLQECVDVYIDKMRIMECKITNSWINLYKPGTLRTPSTPLRTFLVVIFFLWWSIFFLCVVNLFCEMQFKQSQINRSIKDHFRLPAFSSYQDFRRGGNRILVVEQNY